MLYYIIETHTNPDGKIDITQTARQSFASAESYFYERVSKMRMTELYSSASVMLVDQNLHVIHNMVVPTCYVAPEQVAEAE